MLANPQLGQLPQTDQRDAYVAKGALTTSILIKEITGGARTVGLITQEPDDSKPTSDEDPVVDDIHVRSLKLPSDHPAILAEGVLNARLEIVAGQPQAAIRRLETLRGAFDANHDNLDVRQLPILATLADAYQSSDEQVLAADADRAFLAVAAKHPELGRPLSAPTIAAETRLAAFYNRQAAELPNFSRRQAAQTQANTLSAKAAEEHRRSSYYIGNIVPMVTGALPGAAPMSVATRNDPPEPNGGAGLNSAIGSVLDLVVAVSADRGSVAAPFRTGRSGKERQAAFARCVAESGRAFMAWDAWAGMADFRTALKQIDTDTAKTVVRTLVRAKDDDDPLAQVIPAQDRGDLARYGGFAIAGFLTNFGHGDLAEFADAIDSVISEPVLVEFAKLYDSKNEENEKPRQALQTYGMTIVTGVVRVRAVLTDMMREPTEKSIDDARDFENWLHGNKETLAKLDLTLLLLAHPEAEPTDAQKKAFVDNVVTKIALFEPMAAGLTAKAAIAANDVGQARDAAGRSMTRLAEVETRLGVASAAETARSASAIRWAQPDTPAYRQMATQAVQSGIGLAVSASDTFQKSADDQQSGQGASSGASAEDLAKVTALCGTFLTDIFNGLPDDDDNRRARGDALAYIIDAADKAEQADLGPDWVTKIATGDASTDDDLPEVPANLGQASRFSGFDAMLDRASDVLFADLRAMKAQGHNREADIVARLAAEGLQHWLTVPKANRLGWERFAPDGFYQQVIGFFEDNGRDSSARTVADLWAEGKRNSSWGSAPPEARWQTREFHTDRTAWAIDAAMSAGNVERGGVSPTLLHDQETVLNALESANRSALAADLDRKLRVNTEPQDVQDAYRNWAAAAAQTENDRYDDIIQARGRLGLTHIIGEATLVGASDSERRIKISKETNAWDAYVAALQKHGLEDEVQPISLVGLKDSLLPNEIILTALTLQDRVLVVTVSRASGVHLVSSGTDIATLRDAVRRYRRGLTFAASGGAEPFDRAAAEQIWKVLGAPVAQDIAKAERVIWVPPRELDDFPITALPVPETIGPHGWLGLDREIMVSPSLGTLIAMRAQTVAPPADSSLLALGDIGFDGSHGLANWDARQALRATPLAGPTLRAMQKDVPDSVVLTGRDATKAKLVAIGVRRFEVTVFYTHAINDEGSSDCASGFPQALVLYPDANAGRCGNALLTAADVSSLPFRSKVVLLAACATEAQPDGVLAPLDGLTRGFLLGGAHSVVGAHLPVDAAAAALMADRVTSDILARRYGVSLAVKDALIQIEADPRMRDPAYWAQFEVVGEGAPGPTQSSGRQV